MRTTDNHVDTWEMRLAHRAFRREFRVLPGVIASVAPGDHARARLVGEHLTDLSGALRHHHAAEDELLWPVLSGRVGVPSETVRRMENQHVHLHSLLTSVDERAATWQAGARAEDRDRLAEAVTRLSAALDEHLSDEENDILPLVERNVTEAEWRALNERGRDAIPKNAKAFVFLGAILAEASPREAVLFLGQLPVPVRWAWHIVGRRIHREFNARLLGTSSVERGQS